MTLKRISVLGALMLFFPLPAFGASLLLRPAPGPEGAVTVMLSSAEEINALEAVLVLPEQARSVAFVEGGSAVSYWLEAPVYDPARNEIRFSGLMPGGWKGEGSLLTLVLTGARGTLRFDPEQTRVMEHAPEPTEAPLTLGSIRFGQDGGFGGTLWAGLLLLLAALWVIFRHIHIEWRHEPASPSAV